MPEVLLARQLELLSARVDRDVIGPALERVSEYAAVGPRETYVSASDGWVVVQGTPPAALDATEDKRSLFLALQRTGHAAAPMNSPAEAATDPWLAPTAVSSPMTPVRFPRRPRVLDLTHLIAGPFTTYLLELAGADVLKVERPETGDPLRVAGPAQFANLNSAKRRITLDITRPRGRHLLTELMRRSDLVVENFRGGAFQRRYPRAPTRVLSMPGLAAAGLYHGFRSYASIVHALLGLTHLGGSVDVPWSDYVAGAWAANRALDLLSSEGTHDDVFPQAACVRALSANGVFAWPDIARGDPRTIALAPLGEHNDPTYGALGLTEREIDRLYVEGVL